MKKMIVFLFFCLLCVWHNNVYGQNAPDLPQRTGTISATQSLHFGDLTIISGSAGGTVKVDYNGLRTSTGSVVLLNLGNTARQAIFEFKLCPGRTFIVNYQPTVILTGSNGGSLLLHLGPTNMQSNIFTSNVGCNNINLISMGGTLDVKSMTVNPHGLYTGNFELTFIQQ